MFTTLNNHVRPPGAPADWAVHSLSKLPEDAPEGHVRWWGAALARGWSANGLITKATYLRLVEEQRELEQHPRPEMIGEARQMELPGTGEGER